MQFFFGGEHARMSIRNQDRMQDSMNSASPDGTGQMAIRSNGLDRFRPLITLFTRAEAHPAGVDPDFAGWREFGRNGGKI